MARTRSICSIETEIKKVSSELARVQKRQEALESKLLGLQKSKQEFETRQVMEAFRKSGKSLDELLTYLSV